MTTTVLLFAPYIHPDKHIRVRNINPATGEQAAGVPDAWLPLANVVKEFTIHDGASLEVAEVPAPPTA